MGIFNAIFGQSTRQNLAKDLAVARIARMNLDEVNENAQTALIAEIRTMSPLLSG
jgi:hypothetical protein